MTLRNQLAELIQNLNVDPNTSNYVEWEDAEKLADTILSAIKNRLPKEQEVPGFEIYKDGTNNLRSVAWHIGRNELLAEVKQALDIESES